MNSSCEIAGLDSGSVHKNVPDNRKRKKKSYDCQSQNDDCKENDQNYDS